MALKKRDEAVIIAGLLNMIDYYLEGRMGWFDLADLVTTTEHKHERMVAILTKKLNNPKDFD